MLVAVCIEGALLALALLFVFGLLRSHADILRRLHALEGSESALDGGRSAGSAGLGARAEIDIPATLTGKTPGGDAVAISLASGAPRTLLAFLSSGCAVCGPMWDELRQGSPVPAATRLVIVTKGSERESPAKIAALAPPPDVAASGRQIDVVMSSAAYEMLEVPVTPHFMLVESGRLLGRGSATSWSQILTLLGDAEADGGSALVGTSDRAARAEAALAAAGIGAGHPSLYPSRAQTASSLTSSPGRELDLEEIPQ